MGKGAKSKSGREKASGRAAMKASEGDDMEEGNFDDSESVASTTASGSAAEARGGGRGVDEYDMSDIVEKLGEKRYTQREAGWSLLIRYMQANKDENFAELGSADYLETINTLLQRQLRRPSSIREGKLCTQLVALLTLYMGCDESDFYSSYEKLLLQLLSGGDDDREELAISALFALSILSFVTSVDSQATIWDLCEDFLCGEAESTYNSPELKARAAECWVLLAIAAATGEGELVLERSRRRVFEALVELLDESAGSTEIRITAGRVIAFLWETAAEVSGDPSASAIDLGRLLCNHSSMVEQLLRSLQDVVRESSKRISKKDRKEQRSEFRDIEDWVVKGDPPSDTVRMAGAVVQVNSFAQVLTIKALKEVLGSGFHTALKQFQVVRDILDVEHVSDFMDGDGNDSRVSKDSATAKARSTYRKQDRRVRENYKTGTFHGGDDDF